MWCWWRPGRLSNYTTWMKAKILCTLASPAGCGTHAVMHMLTHAHAHNHALICMPSCMLTHTCTRTHSCTHTCMPPRTLIHARTHIHAITHMHTYRSICWTHLKHLSMHIYAHDCSHTQAHLHTSAHTRTTNHERTLNHIHTYTHTCEHVETTRYVQQQAQAHLRNTQ